MMMKIKTKQWRRLNCLVGMVIVLLAGPVRADEAEEVFWRSVKKTDALDEYRLYVEQYPRGKYTGEAWRRIGQKEEAEKSALAGRRAEEEARREAERKRAEADELRPGKVFKDCADCPEMVVIPAGSFEMGSNTGDSDEKPVHTVRIGQPFAIGKTEVTQGQWRALMGNNPSSFSNCGDSCPVEKVSWNDAQEYIKKLNAKTGKTYRLPSEAEWEYACRAGGAHTYCGSDNLDSVAWYGNNSGSKTHPVAQKQANAFGLYDMSGNVWEWVEDSYHNGYNGAPMDGSVWAGDGAKRVLRGGSWFVEPQLARAAIRFRDVPAYRSSGFGFRLARMLP